MKTRLIKIAFYKNSKTFFGFLIRLQQRLQGFDVDDWKYSHAEILFCELEEKDKVMLSANGCVDFYFEGKDIFFSSSEVDGGCRFMTCEIKERNWDFVELEVTEKQYQEALKTAIYYNSCKYSTWGVLLAQGLNINRSDEKKYFCSEMVTIILHKIFGNNFSNKFFDRYVHFINPAKLSVRLRNFLK